MTYNALFFATLKRHAGRDFLERSCFFLIKIENFHQKNQLPSDRFFHGVEGTIYVGFVVNKVGEIVNIKIRRGVSPELNAEAIRVVKLMPKWKAGKQDGELVRVAYTLPVRFQLE